MPNITKKLLFYIDHNNDVKLENILKWPSHKKLNYIQI